MRLAGCWLLLLGAISLHWTTAKGESPSAAAEGDSPQDIIFLVDSTGSIDETEFDELKGFLQKYASRLEDQGYLGRSQTRMGVITWGHIAVPFRVQFPLDMHFDNTSLQGAIEAIPFEMGSTATSDLQAALEFLVDAFAGDFGARSYADHTAVLIVDALATSDSIDIRVTASRVKDANIILYVIGVHEGTVSQSLMDIVSTLEEFGTDTATTGITSTSVATFATVNSDPFVNELVTQLREWSTHCPELSIANGDVVYTDETNFGSIADVQCNFGFTYISTDSLPLECLASGDWSPPIGNCSTVDCGPLADPVNGSVAVISTTFRSEAMYNCTVGYTLVGPDVVVCQSDGTWSEEPPICRAVDCGPLDEPSDGYITYNETTTFGSIAQYSCDFGYTLNVSMAPSLRVCNSSGEWDATAPSCMPFDCGQLPNPPNGAVDTSTGTTYKSLAVYTCDEGYELLGEPVRTCGAFAWNGSEPSCIIVNCGPPEDIAFGSVPGNTFSFGDTLTYVCDLGYVLRGEANRTCQADGSWSNAAPYCELIDCDVLDGIDNGYVTYTGGTLLNSMAEYFCNTGYLLTPPWASTKTCNDTGLWIGMEPSCSRLSCGDPDAPMNGSVAFTSTTYQSVAVYSCAEGFVLEGDRATTCNLAGEWVANTTCRIADCGLLAGILNGDVAVDPDTVFGAVANYSCDVGYILRGNDTRNCDADEQWDNSEPFCMPVDCGLLSSIENGYVRYTTNGTTLGHNVTYGCNPGYNLSMPLTRTCEVDGQWTAASIPVCSAVMCSPLANPLNGVVDVSGGRSYRSIAVYACDTGFVLRGNLTRMCLADGTWDREAPTCERVECAVTTSVANGQVTFPTPTLYTDVVSYNCSAGFELVGPSERSCLADGHLNETRPFCQPNSVPSCDVLNSIANGYIEYTDGTLVGSVATYRCHEGYNIADGGMRMCLSNETWDGIEATCNIVDCMDPPALTNGTVDTSRGTTYQSVAVYQCDEGYTLQGQAITACLDNGTWSGPTPTCAREDCGVLDDIPDGAVSTPQGTLYGATASYSCNSGYRLVGNDTRECQADGSWSGSEPICKAVDCDVLGGIDKGYVQYPSTLVNAYATYICHTGYMLMGSTTRHCQADGLWSGMEPQCNIVDCMDPPALTNGTVDTSRGTTYQSVAVYQCDEGYTLQGQAITACLDNGTWSGPTPTCALVDCGVLDDIPDGAVSTPQGTLYGATASYSCNSGYRLVGNDTRECRADGTWSARMPSCEPVDCRALNAVRNGDIIFSTGTTYTSVAEVTCHEGYELVGSSVRVCLDTGEWAGNPPLCRVKDCGTPSSVQNGSVGYTVDTTFKGRARYTCDIGYDLVGPELRSCQDNRTWSGTDPYCRIRDCGSPPVLLDGQMSFAGTTYLSTANYSCNVGYNLRGPNELTCEVDKMWMPTEFRYSYLYPQPAPYCQIADCGSPGNVSNGNVEFTNGTVYMSNVTVSCNPGYELLGYRQRTCQPDGTWTGSTPQCLAPTPPDNVTVTGVNSTHVLLTWNYPQNVIRQCDAVYQTQPPTGPEMRVTLPFNESEALIDVGEPGAYQFRIICNSTIGQTNFSAPVQAAVQGNSACVGSDLECNPNFIYAIVFPVAALMGAVIVGTAVFIIVKTVVKKPPLPPAGDV